MRLRVLAVVFPCICVSLFGQVNVANHRIEAVLAPAFFTSADAPGSPPPEKKRAETLGAIVPDILADQKSIYWDFPKELLHGKHWIPTSLFLGATAVLIGVDQYSAPHFRRTDAFGTFNTALSGTNTSLVIVAVPVATYVAGLLRSDSYAKKTAYLAAEAYADAQITGEVLKLTTRRARPRSIPLNGNFGDTWLDAPGITDGGFPSGHTIAAFSVATVMANRYGQRHKWVPYVSYGAAGLIGFSRITLSAHDISDVAVGAALGYAITRFIVLRHHDQNH